MIGPTQTTCLFDKEVSDNRNFACIMYSDCLLLACIGGWESFTCKPCSLNKVDFEKEEIIHAQNQDWGTVSDIGRRTVIGPAG